MKPIIPIKRGYCGIGIYHTKNSYNVGTLWRSAMIFGADFIFTIGKRYEKQSSDTVNAINHIPLYHYITFEDFKEHIPYGCQLVAIEQTEKSRNIKNYCHPEKAVYLLGAEDSGIPENILKQISQIIHIDTNMCLNVAVAGSIVLFDRKIKYE